MLQIGFSFAETTMNPPAVTVVIVWKSGLNRLNLFTTFPVATAALKLDGPDRSELFTTFVFC